MKKSIGRQVFELKAREYLTPHYIRITLGGDVSVFKNTTIGDNNKIFIPPKGVNEVNFQALDKQSSDKGKVDSSLAPSVRTYTHKGIDLEKNELIVDFVNHGVNGPASAWAVEANIGDKLGVAMRTEPKELYPNAAWYLLVGDTTAIPVLSAILESLPATAKGICVIEVPTKNDEQILSTQAAITFKWLHNNEPEKGSKLADTVKELTLPSESKFGYVACEFSSVREIRNYLRKECDWTANELHAYSYWKAGVAEDKSVAERQAEKKSI